MRYSDGYSDVSLRKLSGLNATYVTITTLSLQGSYPKDPHCTHYGHVILNYACAVKNDTPIMCTVQVPVGL